MQSNQQSRTYGKWRGMRAFVQDGQLYSVIGEDNGWIREKASPSELEPYTMADLNEPKNRPQLEKIGGAYKGKYTGRNS